MDEGMVLNTKSQARKYLLIPKWWHVPIQRMLLKALIPYSLSQPESISFFFP